MAVIDQHDEFSNVSWHSDHHNPPAAAMGGGAPVFDDSEPVDAHHPEMEEDPTRLDPGLSGDVLECTVSEPRKESDGTKDAFVSYLVTTNVRLLAPRGTSRPPSLLSLAFVLIGSCAGVPFLGLDLLLVPTTDVRC